jgi:hypothetical protein
MTALQQGVATLFRLFALLVLALVLFFPAYKGLWLGYVPVGFGFALSLVWMRRAEGPFLSALSERVFVVLLVLVPALIQLGLLLVLRPLPQSDGLFVYQEAVMLMQTGHLSSLTYYPPAQAVWYAAWFHCFGPSPLVAQLSHLPLHAAVTLLTYGFSRRFAPEAARPVGVAVAFYPSFLAYVLTTPYYHYLYTACVVATAWGWLAMSKRAAWGAGLVSGLGALTKATQLIAPGQAFVFWLLAPRPEKSDSSSAVRGPSTGILLRTVLFGVAMALVLAPWVWRNGKVFDAFVPVCTSGGLVFLSANNLDSNGLYSSAPDQALVKTPREMLDHSRASSLQARQFIRENPARFLQLAARKILHTWGSEATFAELLNQRGQSLGRGEDVFSAAFLTGWSALVLLWAAGAWRALRERRSLTLLELACAVVVGSNLLVYAVFEGGDRHHLPLVPLLVVLAVAGYRRGR